MTATWASLDAELLSSWCLPVDAEGDKFARGTVLIIGGSSTTPGAVLLAGRAALRAGAGRLQIATAPEICRQLAVAMPEALVFPATQISDDPDDGLITDELIQRISDADCVLVGPGLVDRSLAAALVAAALDPASGGPVVLDAEALAAFPESGRAAASPGRMLLMTPNRQELDALLVALERRPAGGEPLTGDELADGVSELAEAVGAVVASFGWIAAPDGRRWFTDAGHPSLGTSGSGDVLAGFAAGLGARTKDPAQAACWATYAHLRAGERLGERFAPFGFLAHELIDAVADACRPLGCRAGGS